MIKTTIFRPNCFWPKFFDRFFCSLFVRDGFFKSFHRHCFRVVRPTSPHLLGLEFETRDARLHNITTGIATHCRLTHRPFITGPRARAVWGARARASLGCQGQSGVPGPIRMCQGHWGARANLVCQGQSGVPGALRACQSESEVPTPV